MTATAAGLLHLQRCPLTNRFRSDTGHDPIVARCIQVAGHVGDCTMIDPRTRDAIRAPKRQTRW